MSLATRSRQAINQSVEAQRVPTKKNRLIAAAIVLALGGLLFSRAVAQQEPSAPPTEEKKFTYWMDVKSRESQKLFSALVLGDFPAIEESAKQLQTTGAIEGFVRRATPGYQTQLRAFEFSIDEIRRQAKRENVEGVALGFHQLTLSCVNCHKQIRDAASTTAKP